MEKKVRLTAVYGWAGCSAINNINLKKNTGKYKMNNEVNNFWKLAFELADRLKELNGYDKYLYVHEVSVDKDLNETGYTVFKFYKSEKLRDELRLRRW